MRIRTLFLAAALSATASTAYALDVTCPQSLQTKQVAENVAAGWVSQVDKVNAPTTIAGVQIYDGPLEELAILEPDNGDTNEPVQIWTFSLPNHGIWVECRYTNTTLTLARRLPDDITSCKLPAPGEDDSLPQEFTVKCNNVPSESQ